MGESGNFECEKKNNCLRYFTTLYSIENIIGANYDLTVREFGGRWGGWYKDGKWKKSDSPHGPRRCDKKGCEQDRDYDGEYDYSFDYRTGLHYER